MNKTSKIVSLVIVFALMMAIVPVGAETFKSEALNKLWVSDAQDLGYPLTNTQFVNSTYSVEDGKNVVYTTASGKPATLVCYNLDDGEIIRELPLAGAKTCWSHGTDSNGVVYIATQSEARLFRFDPKVKKLENLGTITGPSGTVQTALYGVSFDADNNVYLGTYPDPLVVKYDVKAKKFETVAEVFPGENYVRAQAIIGDYIYAYGNATVGSFARVNLKTKKVEKLAQFEYNGVTSTSCNGFTPAGDYIFANISASDKRSLMAIYKISENKWLLNDDQILETNGFFASPELDGKVYVHKRTENKLYAFDLKTEKYEKTEITGSTNRNSKWIEFNTPELPGKTLVTVQSNGSVTYINIEKGTYEDVFTNAAPQPIEMRAVEPGLKGTNTIALSSYMGPKMGILNDITHKVEYLPMSQIEGMGEAFGEYYTCTYPGGNIWKVNFETLEREQLFTISTEKQDRPFSIIEAGDKVAIASMPDYGQLGGAITIYDPKEKSHEIYRNVQKDQTVVSLAYKDGKIYATTSVWGGLGIAPVTDDAHIIIFDMATKKVEKSEVIKLNSISSKTMFAGTISFGSDGKLWGASKGVIFSMDPKTLKVVDEIAIKPGTFAKEQTLASPYAIEWVSDDIMITNAGGVLTAVDIKTKEFRKLYDDAMQYMTVSENSNIYFTSANRVKLFKMSLSLDGDISRVLSVATNNSNMETVPYKNYGFKDKSFIKESAGTIDTAKSKVLTFSGISNDEKATSKTGFIVSGTYKDGDFTKYPQNVEIAEKDGKNALKITAPLKGSQILLQLPELKFDSTYTAEKDYTFTFDYYITPAENVSDASKISLDPKSPKVVGPTDMGCYLRYFDKDGNKISDSSRFYMKSSESWQTANINVPSVEIPSGTAKVAALIYLASGNAAYESYIANPRFVFKGGSSEKGSLNESVILKLDNETAYVNLYKTQVDKNNKDVKPFTIDGRTLVPVRFISESLGAKVDWNGETQTATITLGKNKIEVKLNDKNMIVNGKIKELDVPATTYNDRTMLPLRAVVESLNKEVFWDDRGLIVITKSSVLDPQNDKDTIETIINAF